MAGHSKWANIQHRKGKQDAKRGKLFTKLIREITTAAKLGGPDIEANPRLRLAVDKALSGNMTRDTIDRAIKRGAGEGDTSNMEELTYEGYGPNGVAVMVECMTDNRNRTVSEVRHAFSKCGGNLGTDGSVAYLFKKRGVISFENAAANEDKIMEIAIENGALDVIVNDDHSLDVMTEPEDYLAVKAALQSVSLQSNNAEITMIPDLRTSLDLEQANNLTKLVDMLEDLDDVQNVYTNADISDEVAAQME